MRLTKEKKLLIASALKADEKAKKATYSSRNKYANSIGIHASTVGNIINEKWLGNTQLVSDAKWIEVANAIGFVLKGKKQLALAETETYIDLTTKMMLCKQESLALAFCDMAGIGKTFTIEQFAAQNANVYVVSGSDVPKKTAFIKELGRVLGLKKKGSYDDLLSRIIEELQSQAINNPLIVIDEAGDLDAASYVPIKRLMNKLEDLCGIFMIGANNFKAEIEKGRRLERKSFSEVFSRLKSNISSITENDVWSKAEFLKRQTVAICEANGIDEENTARIVNKVVVFPESRTQIPVIVGDMRRVKVEIVKMKYAA